MVDVVSVNHPFVAGRTPGWRMVHASPWLPGLNQDQQTSRGSVMTRTVPTAECPPKPDTPTVVLAGPSGLGTSSAQVLTHLTRPHDPAYAERAWGDGTASPLYCPAVERVNDPLAAEVDRRLVNWANDCGFADEEVEQFGKAGFGNLVVLTHPDSDDPDHLLIAAQMNAAWWAADDLYADDSERGASPTELPPRLAIAMAAMDPVAPAGEFTAALDEALLADPVLVALTSSVDHMSRHSTPSQVQRACYSTSAMFVSWNSYAAWRHTGDYPPAWKYLATRQHDSFATSMTLIDIVGGYELAANLYYEPRVRRALMRAGTAAVLVNDLYSVTRDAADEKPVCNMVLQIAADRDCSIAEATETTVELHNKIVREFEAGHRELQTVPSLELQKFLRGLRAWMGGSFEWHTTNPRYQT
jgi:2-methylisoborneol synthase